MLSITGFIENRRQKAEEQRKRDLEAATLRRDIYGPSYNAKQRRKDVKVLREEKPPAMTSKTTGEPFPPRTAEDIGDGFRSKQKKKALPKYNATRPFGQRG